FADGFEAGVLSGIQSGIYSGIGEAKSLGGPSIGNLGAGITVKRVLAHGLVGGAFARARGDSFGSGFATGVFSKLSAGTLSKNFSDPFTGAAASAIIGGTASTLSGGKFANGALSGAFGYLFNQVAGRNRRAAQLAAARQTAQTRSPDTIYITGHRVGVAGPYHTAIEYVDTSGHSEWLSAGPDGVSREGLVSLLSAPGRSSDHPSLNRLFGRVIPPSGMSSASYFQELQSADAFYCDCVDYDLFPGMANGYNSNSYVNSLIGVTGGSTTVNLGGFVGGGKTIPEMYFW
ncbi:hypothetical protein, partial [Thiolapillus sp.]